MGSPSACAPPAGTSIIGRLAEGLTLVSLFAGCGGSSCGYKAAGYDIRLAVEWDPAAVACYRENFPVTPVYQGDIAGLSGEEALRLARVAPGELDVLDGSPPCQGFSSAGRRRMGDARNRLFEEYVRLLLAFRPRALIMENVSGLRKGKMRLAFAEIHRALKGAGYRVSCRELNAWWYGVPQDRRRLFWVGIRDGLGARPAHPDPICCSPVTPARALAGICVKPWGRDFQDTKTGRAMRRVRPGHAQADHYTHCKLHPIRPCPTLRHDFLGWFHLWHWSEGRPMRLAEWSRLQGFPDSFIWPDGEKRACPLIGNSVPPPMAEAVGRKVAEILRNGHPE